MAGAKAILQANPAPRRLFGFAVPDMGPLSAHHKSALYQRAVNVTWAQSALLHENPGVSGSAAPTTAPTSATPVRRLLRRHGGRVAMVQFRNNTEEADFRVELDRVIAERHGEVQYC